MALPRRVVRIRPNQGTNSGQAMFTIRQTVLEILFANSLSARDERMVNYLRQRFPRELQSIADPHLYEVVRFTRKIADRYQIGRENDIATLADFVIMYGSN